MKSLLFFALCCISLQAQTLTYVIHDVTGATPDVPLPANYQFASTPQGSSASVVIKATNSSPNPVQLAIIYIGPSAGSTAPDPNFSLTGLDEDATLAPGDSIPFTINFTPATTGSVSGYLQAVYLVQQNGCVLDSSSDATRCTSTQASISTLSGTATAPQLELSYSAAGASPSVLQPESTARLDFGNVSASATASIVFTLSNETAQAIATPSITMQSQVFGSSAFALNSTTFPASVPANGSINFTVTFAPGQTGQAVATLVVGQSTYGLQGTGIVLADIDALQISYLDSAGDRTLPQAATPIDFGQIVPGTPGGVTLNFTVTNPTTSFNAISLPALSVSGAAYSLSGAPTLPATIQPGASINFQVVFSASASGTYTGSLTIGSRVFSLTGLGVSSPVPAVSFQLSQQTLTSQQQVNLSVQFASAATVAAIGQLTMKFQPSVLNVTDDPAILFLATGGRTLTVNVAAGAQSATYSGQTALAFQTGTTAGTITFTLTFPDTPPYTQSFTITPQQIAITSAEALRQSPNLVVTVNGFDNTYTAGQLAFTFYDLKGAAINTTPLPVDATSAFHQYFFTDDQAGGAFAVQASFPVTGDPTQVGSVGVTLTNSSGQTTTKLAFQ